MKKVLFLLLFLVWGCSAGIKASYDITDGDKDAEYSQALMVNTVKFLETITVTTTPQTSDSPSESSDFWSAGSGVVVKVDKLSGTSMILTAWHVCDRYPVGYKEEGLFATYEVSKENQVVITIDEEELKDPRILYKDKDNDICVVEVDHVFPSHATLAEKMPPKGAYVEVVGAPLGTWGNHLVSMSRGQYFGVMTIHVILGLTDTDATKLKDFAYYGFAGVGGFSGSGIYYKGKLVGIHTAGSGRYEHASYGPTIKAVKKALFRAGY